MLNQADQWFEYAVKAVDKLSSHEGDLSKLSTQEAEMAALWKLEVDVHNGGFIQFFCNWGIDCYRFAREALTRIEAEELLKIVEMQFAVVDAVYQREKGNLKSYWDIPTKMTQEEIEKMDGLDGEFWERPDDICRPALEIYKGVL